MKIDPITCYKLENGQIFQSIDAAKYRILELEMDEKLYQEIEQVYNEAIESNKNIHKEFIFRFILKHAKSIAEVYNKVYVSTGETKNG